MKLPDSLAVASVGGAAIGHVQVLNEVLTTVSLVAAIVAGVVSIALNCKRLRNGK